ncbi:MAG TPA: hypothetical protein PK253_02065 [Spirochaetota bacterium]|nr:hypothetical protein [Spirochaetota bacterium]
MMRVRFYAVPILVCLVLVLGASRGIYSAETGGATGAPAQDEPAQVPKDASKKGTQVPSEARKKQATPKGSEPLNGQQKALPVPKDTRKKQEPRKDTPQLQKDIAGKAVPAPGEKKKLVPEEKKVSPKDLQKKDLPREQINRPGVPEPRLENIIPGIGKKAETLKEKKAPKEKKGELRPPEARKETRRNIEKKRKQVPRETPPRREEKDIRREVIQEKKEPEKQKEPEKEIVPVISQPFYGAYSFGESADREFGRDWVKTLTAKEIAYWCRSRSMVPVPDAKPVVNNKASFVSRYGSVISVKGLQRNRRYRAWIDFVRFRAHGDCGVSARLEVYGDRKLLKSFRYRDLQEMRKPFVLNLPYEITYDGAVELKFREYSDTGGFWGVWDVVVSDQYDLPDTLPGDAADKAGTEMKIRDPLIEGKKELRPDKPAVNR